MVKDHYRSSRTSDDLVFGQITFSKGVWSGKVVFAPVGRKVEIYIYVRGNSGNDLSERHRNFFREAENRYPVMASHAAQKIVKRYPYYTENFTPARVWEEFALERIFIEDNQGKMLLTLSFRSLTEMSCCPSFTFRIKEPWKVETLNTRN